MLKKIVACMLLLFVLSACETAPPRVLVETDITTNTQTSEKQYEDVRAFLEDNKIALMNETSNYDHEVRISATETTLEYLFTSESDILDTYDSEFESMASSLKSIIESEDVSIVAVCKNKAGDELSRRDYK